MCSDIFTDSSVSSCNGSLQFTFVIFKHNRQAVEFVSNNNFLFTHEFQQVRKTFGFLSRKHRFRESYLFKAVKQCTLYFLRRRITQYNACFFFKHFKLFIHDIIIPVRHDRLVKLIISVVCLFKLFNQLFHFCNLTVVHCNKLLFVFSTPTDCLPFFSDSAFVHRHCVPDELPPDNRHFQTAEYILLSCSQAGTYHSHSG